MKNNFYIFLVTFLILNLYSVSAMGHSSSEIWFNSSSNAQVTNLHQAIEKNLLMETNPPFVSHVPSSGDFGHNLNEIYVNVNGTSGSLATFLENGKSLCGSGSYTYQGNIIFGHRGEEITLSNGKNLQQAINDGDFCAIKCASCNDCTNKIAKASAGSVIKMSKDLDAGITSKKESAYGEGGYPVCVRIKRGDIIFDGGSYSIYGNSWDDKKVALIVYPKVSNLTIRNLNVKKVFQGMQVRGDGLAIRNMLFSDIGGGLYVDDGENQEFTNISFIQNHNGFHDGFIIKHGGSATLKNIFCSTPPGMTSASYIGLGPLPIGFYWNYLGVPRSDGKESSRCRIQIDTATIKKSGIHGCEYTYCPTDDVTPSCTVTAY